MNVPGMAATVIEVLGDTGAFDHMLDEKDARTLGIPIKRVGRGEEVRVITGNGQVTCDKKGLLEITPGDAREFNLLKNVKFLSKKVIKLKNFGLF